MSTAHPLQLQKFIIDVKWWQTRTETTTAFDPCTNLVIDECGDGNPWATE